MDAATDANRDWWGAAEGEPEDASWKTGSAAKEGRMARYIEWLLTPKALREPNSKAKLADELGVHPQTLRNYQKDPLFQRRLLEEGREIARVDQVPDILENLYNIARDPNHRQTVSAARTFLDHVERMVPPSGSTPDVKSMTSEELTEMAVRLLNEAADG